MGQCTPDVQGRPRASGSPATADLSIPPYSSAIRDHWFRLVRSHLGFRETDEPEKMRHWFRAFAV